MLRRLGVFCFELLLIGGGLFVVGWLLGPTERFIRIFGTALQFLGLLTVLLDVSRNQVEHKVHGLTWKAVDIIKRLHFFRGRRLPAEAGGFAVQGGAARGYGGAWTKPQDNSLE